MAMISTAEKWRQCYPYWPNSIQCFQHLSVLSE